MGALERKRLQRIKESVIIRDGLICCYCNSLLTLNTVTMEHIVPDSKRGTYNTTNLTVSCSNCNNKRGNKPFFEYCKQFNFTKEKLAKYRKLYFANLRIKILNIAKEECLNSEEAIPNSLIEQACNILRINTISFNEYEKQYHFDIVFSDICERRKIKFIFEQLIKIIESSSM